VSSADGVTYIADSRAVRALSPRTGQLETRAGTGAPGPVGNDVPAASTNLQGACSVTRDKAGNLLISDSQANLVRVVAAQW
jgi:hypothetical protein